jgi:hypothetical protein
VEGSASIPFSSPIFSYSIVLLLWLQALMDRSDGRSACRALGIALVLAP